jgi:hypothetical protein
VRHFKRRGRFLIGQSVQCRPNIGPENSSQPWHRCGTDSLQHDGFACVSLRDRKRGARTYVFLRLVASRRFDRLQIQLPLALPL